MGAGRPIALMLMLAACEFPKLAQLPDAPADTMVDASKGAHYHYIIDSMRLPASNAQAQEYGVDLNDDGTIDNQLGMVLSTLTGMGFDFQTPINRNIAEGKSIQLVDFQTSAFSDAPIAGLQTFYGKANPTTPSACNTSEVYNPMTMTGCKRHLD